jgi:hypothetical protein
MLRRFGLRCTSISEYNEGNFRAERRALSGFVTPASGLTALAHPKDVNVSFLRGVGMMGAGITSCVQFGMEYIKNPEVVERIYFSWAQGYMSQRNAMQMLLDATQRDLRGWQIDDQKKKLRTFCSENPHLDFVLAVNDLYMALPEHRPAK